MIDMKIDLFFFQFPVNFVRHNFLKQFGTQIKILNLLTKSSRDTHSSKEILSNLFNVVSAPSWGNTKRTVSKQLLKLLEVSEDELKTMFPGVKVEDPAQKSTKPRKSTTTPPTTPTTPSIGPNLVQSSRVKSIDEPSSPEKEDDTSIESVLSLNKESQKVKKKSTKAFTRQSSVKSVGSNSGNNDFATVFGKRKDLTEYLNDDGSVAYALLLKSEIAQMDRRLVEECKDKCQIGGLIKWNMC